ncbi:hypothetical protein GH714_032061 [Hevea brasiliensis]|uniref:Pentatricopeptide repeat-containing protein n=1 Tax=Hevea brasiliensis TaxID=3981 RepID=A0A6A6LDG3_HEVBR|nr:hypothetical protein GH714_032061 [Hevea brasiliensis]
MSSSIQPNYVTFLGVLCACSHAGLVDDGFLYFHEKMEHRYKIKPMMVHYGAMFDILGRAGSLKEAYDFIMSPPFQPDALVWRTLLSACSVRDVNDRNGVAYEVRKKLLELKPTRSGNLVMVANMHVDAGTWEKAENVRRYHGNQFLVAFTIGVTINAYFDMGLTRVVYIATLELNFLIGRFKVTCDSTSDPNIEYPITAIDA